MKQKYTLQILTPVHIGSGKTLNQIDGCYMNGRWYHIDLDKVLAHPSTDLNRLTSEMATRNFRWQRHLQQHAADLSELSAYSLPCPRSPEEVEIREAITAVGNRPYLPGSTLKGAIRTALLGEILDEADHVYDESLRQLATIIAGGPRGNPGKEAPGRPVESLAFGKDPNHDLLRALQVSDTEPLNSEALEIGMAWTVTLNQRDQLVQKIEGNREYKNFVQQFRANQRLTFTLKIDEHLFREHEKNHLGFKDLQENVIRDIPEVCRSATAVLMDRELEFFEKYGFSEIANIYDRLIRINAELPEGAFLLQIGWGTGYHTNTVTSLYADGEEPALDWMDIRERFRLGESPSRRGGYDEREFPKTRRILYRGQNPIAPLGWVKISRLKD